MEEFTEREYAELPDQKGKLHTPNHLSAPAIFFACAYALITEENVFSFGSTDAACIASNHRTAPVGSAARVYLQKDAEFQKAK